MANNVQEKEIGVFFTQEQGKTIYLASGSRKEYFSSLLQIFLHQFECVPHLGLEILRPTKGANISFNSNHLCSIAIICHSHTIDYIKLICYSGKDTA